MFFFFFLPLGECCTVILRCSADLQGVIRNEVIRNEVIRNEVIRNDEVISTNGHTEGIIGAHSNVRTEGNSNPNGNTSAREGINSSGTGNTPPEEGNAVTRTGNPNTPPEERTFGTFLSNYNSYAERLARTTIVGNSNTEERIMSTGNAENQNDLATLYQNYQNTFAEFISTVYFLAEASYSVPSGRRTDPIKARGMHEEFCTEEAKKMLIEMKKLDMNKLGLERPVPVNNDLEQIPVPVNDNLLQVSGNLAQDPDTNGQDPDTHGQDSDRPVAVKESDRPVHSQSVNVPVPVNVLSLVGKRMVGKAVLKIKKLASLFESAENGEERRRIRESMRRPGGRGYVEAEDARTGLDFLYSMAQNHNQRNLRPK